MDVMRRAEAGRRAQQMSEADETVRNTPIRIFAALLIVVLSTLLGLWFFDVVEVPRSWVGGDDSSAYEAVFVDPDSGVSFVSKVDSEGRFLIYDGSSWFDSDFVVGVRLPALSLPGDGDAADAPAQADYERWMGQARDLDVALLHLDEAMPPAFYAALAAFNEGLSVPMWLLHGIAAPTGSGESGEDAFLALDAARAAVEDTVEGVHAAGVPHFVLGWVVHAAPAPDPLTVQATNVANRGRGFAGEFLSTADDALPYEAWLAELMDLAVQTDMAHEWQRPVSFGSTQALDPLAHPSEGNSTSADLVSLFAGRIAAEEPFEAGQWASFSAYPYAPAFMRYEYNGFTRPNGASIDDPFAAYLWALRDAHDDSGLPVMVTAMGLPVSLGMAHDGAPLARHKGNMTEFEAAGHLTDMIHLANDYGYLGVMLDSLLHEWGSVWLDALDPDQHFGAVVVEPLPTVTLDGSAADWTAATLRYTPTVMSTGSFEMQITHDEAYLYLLLTKAEGVAWALGHDEIWIGLDTIDGSGPTRPDVSPVSFANGVEVTLGIDGSGANLYLRRNLDPYPARAIDDEIARLAGQAVTDDDDDGSYDFAEDEFILFRNVTEMPHYRADILQIQAASSTTLGDLIRGKTDLDESSSLDTRALWFSADDAIELRLPWRMLGFDDPSTSSAWRLDAEGNPVSYPVAAGNATAFRGVQMEPVLLQDGEVVSRPDAVHYQWDLWDEVCFCERFSMGAEILLTATQLYSIIGTSGRRLIDIDNPPTPYLYCACGPDEAAATGFEASVLIVLVGLSLFILLSFYLFAKLTDDPIHDIQPAGMPPRLYNPFRPLWFLAAHPKLRRRLRFVLYYATVGVVLGVTHWWVLKQAQDWAESVLDQVNYAFLGMINVEILTIAVAVVLCEWPSEPKPYPSGYPPEYHAHIKRVALLITCHNSADRIRETLAAALGTFEPHQIFVCDNGRSMHPSDDTREETIDVSDEYHIRFREPQGLPYKPINYIWIPEGSKVVATRHVVHHYVDSKHFDFCMTIDDDVLLAPHLYVPFGKFKDPRVQALAFTLAAENNKLPDGTTPPLNTLQRLQDLEYKLAGFAKILQTYFGSALFAHGAVGFWRRDAFAKVLERHDTMHMGDDLQLGLILHGLDDPLELDGLRGGYIVAAAGEVSVSTQVPSCFYHHGDFRKYARSIVMGLVGIRAGGALKAWAASARECKTNAPSRLPTSKLREELRQLGLPHSGPRYKLVQTLRRVNEAESDNTPCAVGGCRRLAVAGTAECGVHGGYACGEPSLFAQRVMGWDCTEQRFFLKFCKIILKGLVGCNLRASFVVLMCLGQLYIIFMDWLRLPISILLVLGGEGSRNQFVGGLIISFAFQVLVLTAFNELVLKRRHGNVPLGVKRLTIIVLPIYKMWNAIVFRSLATLYNATYYLLIEKNKAQIMERATYCCHEPYSQEHRCMRTELQTGSKSTVLVEVYKDKQYQAPYFYFCPNGHMPPGPKTVGTDEEKRAYTDILKQYEVLAEFDDDDGARRMNDMEGQIADLQQQLQAVMADLERQRLMHVPAPAPAPAPLPPPDDDDDDPGFDPDALRAQLAADQARLAAEAQAEHARQQLIMIQKMEERHETAAAAAARAADERAARADEQISSLASAVTRARAQAPSNAAVDHLQRQLEQIRLARAKLNHGRVAGPPSMVKPVPKVRVERVAGSGDRVSGPPRGAGDASVSAVAYTKSRMRVVRQGLTGGPAAVVPALPPAQPQPPSSASSTGSSAGGGSARRRTEPPRPEVQLHPFAAAPPTPTGAPPPPVDSPPVQYRAHVAGPPAGHRPTPRGRLRRAAASKKAAAAAKYRVDGPPS